MSKIRQVLVEAPGWCGLYDASRWARIAGIAFDEEVADKESVGKRLPDETIPDRLRTVLAWRNYVPSLEGQQIGAYVQNLLVFAALSIDKNQGKDYHHSSWENLGKIVREDSKKFRSVIVRSVGEDGKEVVSIIDISNTLSPEEAEKLDFWN